MLPNFNDPGFGDVRHYDTHLFGIQANGRFVSIVDVNEFYLERNCDSRQFCGCIIRFKEEGDGIIANLSLAG
jgi:hypothetical protein